MFFLYIPGKDDDGGRGSHDSSWGLHLPERVARGGGGGRGGLQELRGHEKTVTSLSVTEDSGVLVSGSEDGSVRSWHVASRQCVQQTAVAEKGDLNGVPWYGMVGRKLGVIPCYVLVS